MSCCHAGFTLPLLVFGGLEGLIAILLLLPLPFCRPAILICKLTKTHAGRTVVITISVVLLALLLAPLYDLVHMHDRPEDTAGASPERRYLDRGRLHAAQANARYMLSSGSC